MSAGRSVRKFSKSVRWKNTQEKNIAVTVRCEKFIYPSGFKNVLFDWKSAVRYAKFVK